MTTSAEQVVLKPHAMSYRGTAVARLGGQAVFVAGALPGEEVIAAIQRRHRDFLEASVVEVVEGSPDRCAARCSHFAEAGSCEWEFISYAEQLRLKTEILGEQLRRLGHFTELPLLPAIESPDEWGYRNHARFVIDSNGDPCYLRRASHTPIPIDSCAVLCPTIDAVLPSLRGKLRRLGGVELRYGVYTGELFVAPSLDGRHIELPTGQESYQEELLGRRFRISSGSFFQVNTRAAEVLVKQLLESLDLSGSERVADLYAGVGTFACLIAAHAQAVFAVESAPDAVEDGRLNSGFLENVRFRKGTVEELLPRIDPAPNVVLLDPPRAGCSRAAMAALLAARPHRIAYCSCDTATLARDLRLLADDGYQLDSVRVVDMFPQTPHIESLSVLHRGG